jgi:uncharacterized protein YcfJ
MSSVEITFLALNADAAKRDAESVSQALARLDRAYAAVRRGTKGVSGASLGTFPPAQGILGRGSQANSGAVGAIGSMVGAQAAIGAGGRFRGVSSQVTRRASNAIGGAVAATTGARVAGTAASALSGALLGGKIGSIVPVIGTAIGVVVGSLIGNAVATGLSRMTADYARLVGVDRAAGAVARWWSGPDTDVSRADFAAVSRAGRRIAMRDFRQVYDAEESAYSILPRREGATPGGQDRIQKAVWDLEQRLKVMEERTIRSTRGLEAAMREMGRL